MASQTQMKMAKYIDRGKDKVLDSLLCKELMPALKFKDRWKKYCMNESCEVYFLKKDIREIVENFHFRSNSDKFYACVALKGKTEF